jgi:hypothetical protein
VEEDRTMDRVLSAYQVEELIGRGGSGKEVYPG